VLHPWIRQTAAFNLTALALCLGALAAQAQGYELRDWPANKPTPALTGTDLQGKRWQLSQLRGKAVLLNFWASWCEPCGAEMPSLDTLAQVLGPDKLVVLAVNFKESEPVVQRYAQRTGLSLTIILDPQGTIAREWGATVFPTTVLVAADGRARSVVRGEFDWSGQKAAKLVERLAGEQR
jgi:thiol-disulfide isomerase/thioredoxin